MKQVAILLISVGLSIISFPTIAQMGANNYDFEIKSSFVGDNGSDASFSSVGFNKSLFEIQLKNEQKGIIKTSLNYEFTHINLNTEDSHFTDIENFHSIGITISYIQKINQKWSFVGMFSPQLSSNFTNNLSSDDFYANIIALFNYSKTQNNRLSFGLVYTNSMGVPFPIPIINYWKKFDDKWQMNLGFPRTNLTYTLNPTSNFSGYIEFDGFKANISQNMSRPYFEDERMAEQIKYNAIISGIEYDYHIKKFQFKINLGYTLSRNFEFQDSDNDTAYEFDMRNNFNLGVGVGLDF